MDPFQYIIRLKGGGYYQTIDTERHSLKITYEIAEAHRFNTRWEALGMMAQSKVYFDRSTIDSVLRDRHLV